MPDSDIESDLSIDEKNVTEINYNPEFEQLLKETGDHAQVYSILHQMAYIKYKHMFDMFNIPLIILTSVIGFVTGIGINYEYMGIILGGSSVFVSIMKSVVSYMRLSERSENHRICSLQFGQISNEIKIDLSLRREQRQPAKILLDVIKVKFKNLMEVAQILDEDIIGKFRDKYFMHYNQSSVSLPPLFSEIPGIKILGTDSEQEHALQLQNHLERYIAEKKFERDQVTYELQHIAELRSIRDKFRVPERKPQCEVDEENSESSMDMKQSRRTRSLLPRQRSTRNEYSSGKPPQEEAAPVSTVVVIPQPQASLQPSPPQPSEEDESSNESQEEEVD